MSYCSASSQNGEIFNGHWKSIMRGGISKNILFVLGVLISQMTNAIIYTALCNVAKAPALSQLFSKAKHKLKELSSLKFRSNLLIRTYKDNQSIT